MGLFRAFSINHLEPGNSNKKKLNKIFATIKADVQRDNLDNILNSSQYMEKHHLANKNKTIQQESFKNYSDVIFGFRTHAARQNGSVPFLNCNKPNHASSIALSIKINNFHIQVTNAIYVALNRLATSANSFLEMGTGTQPCFAGINFGDAVLT